MHSNKYAQRLKERYEILDDPNSIIWEDRAGAAFDQLTALLGEKATDEWFDEHITDNETWKSVTEKLARKVMMMSVDPIAFTRIDRSEQAHPGVN